LAGRRNVGAIADALMGESLRQEGPDEVSVDAVDLAILEDAQWIGVLRQQQVLAHEVAGIAEESGDEAGAASAAAQDEEIGLVHDAWCAERNPNLRNYSMAAEAYVTADRLR
jgi:hypothetical protein